MYGQIATRLHQNAWRPIPLRPFSKIPSVRGWQQWTSQPIPSDLIAYWVRRYPRHNVGIVADGSWLAVDWDVAETNAAGSALRYLVRIVGRPMMVRVGQPYKWMGFYRQDVRQQSGRFSGLDIFASSGQVAVFGIHPDTRAAYQWLRDISPLRLSPTQLTTCDPARLQDWTQAVAVRLRRLSGRCNWSSLQLEGR